MIPRRNLHQLAGSGLAVRRAGLALLLAAVLSGAGTAVADEKQDRAMRQLAAESGCLFCHKEVTGKPGVDEMLPVAPSWTGIARRYRGQSGVEDRLVGVVIGGSGKGPKERHWAGRTRDASMPSNPVEISPDDARILVRWILARK